MQRTGGGAQPPKTLSVQMSLTPVPLKSFLPGDSICGDTEGTC